MFDLFSQPKTPKPHQIKVLDGVRDAIRAGYRRIVVQLPTGGGKTFVGCLIFKGALSKGNISCFTVPAIELIDQTLEAFEEEGIDRIGVIQADHPRRDPYAPALIASVQTLARRELPKARIVLVDEAHIYARVVVEWMEREPNTLFIGLSATPWRKGMAEEWQTLVAPVTMQDLIDKGVLCPFRVFAPTQPDLSKVKTKMGDYDEGQLAAIMSDKTLVADVVSTWLEKAEDRPTLCFAVDRAHAKKLQQQFEAHGVPTGYVDAYTPKLERKLLQSRFARGEVKVVCNVGVLTTGVDWDVRCISMVRPTKSEMLWVQMFGRMLRTAEGKADAIMLDHTSNALRLGFPTDIHHPSLLARKTERQEAEPREKVELPKACPACTFLCPPGVYVCPCCGFKPERKSGIQTQDGELEELRARPRPATMAEKQLFWSMALYHAADKGKPKLAKALYREKYGVWPKGLRDIPTRPNREWLNYEHSRRIAYAKRMAKREATNQGVPA